MPGYDANVVLNGGFELCTAGDGYPDYWNYRRPQHLYLKGSLNSPQIPHLIG